ncbi:FecR domain-containing protein [Pseudomonas sp. Pseusp122]|uniref:FecR domain-containing protein n=1 Tax=unclassified Pseudomonas TaxID=196821 RepID=UPI0039A71F65
MATTPDRKTFTAAANWYVQFQSEPPTPAQHQAWQRWLESDPAHQAAWQHMEQLQHNLGALPRDLTRRALSDTQQRRQVLRMLLILAGVGGVGWALQEQTSLGNVWADHRTWVGERKRLDLADGTRLELNTDTAVDVVFDERQRLIHLRAGEIFIRTGKRGDTRPFFVETRQGRVQALGTSFSVRQLSHSTHVGVLEDQVRVLPKAGTGQDGLLKAGESADFDSYRLGPSRVCRPAETAWIDGQLIVLDARLGDVIDELSRYRSGAMQCDERAARLRVSGAFRLDAIDAVLANLQTSLPIQVNYFTRYWVSIKYRG